MTTPEPLSARYRIDGELGRGGMATVWRAHDLHRLDVVHAGEHTFDLVLRIRAVAAAQLFTEISTASGRRARSV